MKVQIENPIPATNLDDVNYVIELVNKHDDIDNVKGELSTCNFPSGLFIYSGGSHIAVHSSKSNSERILFIS